jgi:histidine triad (HIT) family protein
MAEGCVFCAIAAGKARAHVIDEDQWTISFLDVAPSTPGHVLVIPKRHAADIWEIEPHEFAAVMETVRRLSLRLRERLDPDGLNVINSCRPAGWQTVFHLHVHVIPRYVDDQLRSPWKPRPADPAALAELAARLR